jgi:hypothetical protein
LADPAVPILIGVTHTKFPTKIFQEAVRAADRKPRAKVLINFANLDAPDTTSTVIAIIAYISIYSIHYDIGYKRYDPLTNDTIEILFKCGRSVVEIAKITHVAEITVRRKKRLLHMFETVNLVSLAVQKRFRALLPIHNDAIIDFLDEYLLAFVDEINVFIWEKFDLRVIDSII